MSFVCWDSGITTPSSRLKTLSYSRLTVCPYRFTSHKYAFRKRSMHPLALIHYLRHGEVGRHAHQRVGVLAESPVGHQEVEHLQAAWYIALFRSSW